MTTSTRSSRESFLKVGIEAESIQYDVGSVSAGAIVTPLSLDGQQADRQPPRALPLISR
jgi:hypothetical protein